MSQGRSSGGWGTIDVWGDGTAIRSYTYIDDIIEGVYLLKQSDLNVPVNIGSSQYVTVSELVPTVTEAANKKINIRYIKGPVGVQPEIIAMSVSIQ